MNRYIVEEFYQGPALSRRLESRARRERVRMLAAAFRWLRDRLTPRVTSRVTSRLHLRDHLARLG